ncbi:heme b synthase [Aneurinibacillus terranovensis]|uniref:heme b synthase n=1 Tax=Aneurinibacillus terranovensis TaxID=278991 RepID=UPI001FE15B9D|nr:heme b synthase [Aneurinibacillus terranovensis]
MEHPGAMPIYTAREKMKQMSTEEAGQYMKNKKNQLRLIFWELTEGCNLKCVHCRATAQPQRNPDELSTEEAFRMIDEIAGFANPIIILTGGEPLYRPDIFEIAGYATSKGLRIALASNGTLINEEMAKKIKKAGVQRVSISLDGARQETHDQFRGIHGAFQTALNGARHLVNQGVPIQFNTTITTHNVQEIEQVMQLALDEKATALHLFMLVPVGCGAQLSATQMIPAAEYERVLNWFYDQSLKVPLELKATCAPHYFRIMRQRAKAEGIQVTSKTHGMAAMTKGCLAGTGVCFLSHKGIVQPCGYLPVEAGNIRRQTIQEIWEGSEIFSQLRDTANLKGKCGICEYRNVCEGCRARAYGMTGDLLAEEPFCIYQPKQAVSD